MGENRRYLIGLARAAGGAIIFALPLLMTMEMWWLGFTIDRERLLLLAIVLLPTVAALSHRVGFEAPVERGARVPRVHRRRGGASHPLTWRDDARARFRPSSG